jgi:hypothetical protein
MTQGAFLQGSQHAPEVPSALPGHCRHGTAGLTNEAVMILIYIYSIYIHIYIYICIYIYNGYYNPLINKLMRISQYNNSTWLGSSLVKHCNSGNHGIFFEFCRHLEASRITRPTARASEPVAPDVGVR